MPSRAEFNALLFEHLVPDFCSDERRGMDASGFISSSNYITELDAEDFLLAWHTGLCVHQGNGQYLFGQGTVKEQFFWSGAKKPDGRTFTLWMEPVITLAAMGRLHLTYRWPLLALASQSDDWAFDIVTALPGRDKQLIAGEVKKSRTEVDELIRLMVKFGEEPGTELTEGGRSNNALKKIKSLRINKPEILWVIGPSRYELVFRINYHADYTVNLTPAPLSVLEYAGWG